jgi:hypothetical protein
MKKPLYLRILLLILLYAGVFTLIVVIQFPKQGGFSRKIGDFIVNGHYRPNDGSAPLQDESVYLLSGKASVVFGGIEFCLGHGAEGSVLRFLDNNGGAEEMLPEFMAVSKDTALFSFSGAAEISFTSSNQGHGQEMLIYCAFSGDYTGLELPFRPLSKTGITDSGNRQLIITSGGLNYSFDSASMDMGRSLIFLDTVNPVLSYRANILNEKKNLVLEDFIIPMGKNKQSYTDAVKYWADQNVLVWNRMFREQNDEDLVIALVSEIINRGNYKETVSAVTPAFLNGDRRTYQSSVYLGQLDTANRSLTAADQAKTGLLSRQINERSADFLLESQAVEYLAVRGYSGVLNNAAEIARSFDTDQLVMELIPGIFEAYTDWEIYRPRVDNPFARLIDAACSVVFGALRQTDTGAKVFVCTGDTGSLVDIEFNLRLGKALLVLAEKSGDDAWAAVARSIVLSSLFLGEETNKKSFFVTDNDEISEDPSSPRIGTAHLYRMLNPGLYFPRAVALGEATGGIWAWTAASALNISREGGVLDIAVSFPAGETHYMIIRGIPQFGRIQLYGMDYPTDPQFERYDSMGWTYAAAGQTLLIKMKHRDPVEHIRVYFNREISE